MKTNKALTPFDVDAAKQDFEVVVREYLKARGWKSTCNNPASLWLWEKAIPDGRVLLVDDETALLFERMTFTGEEES